MLAASMLIQAATNMVNEYYDFQRGLDNEEMVGIAGTIVRDRIPAATVGRIAVFTLMIAALLGVYICASTSWWVAVAGLGSMLFIYLYSGGPNPISYTPFGEVTSGAIMGPVIILIAYFIQTGILTAAAALASGPIGILIGCILLANNIRDIEHDRAGGRRTLPIVLGRRNGVRILGWSFLAAYGWLFALMATGRLTWWAALTLLFAPVAARVPGKLGRAATPDAAQRAFKAVSQTLIAFGFLLFIGLMLNAVLR